jgi:Activator of Hsp90 ATPase homolog 1-like protein
MTEPLRLSFEVGCTPEHAFATWTQRTSRWWPVSHTVTAEPGLYVTFEPRVGGRIFERSPSGQEVDWGEITAWDPPRRLAYLWFIRTDRADATDVEVTFSATEVGGTRVDIEHSGWERLGARGPGWRDVNRAGWSGVIPVYQATCTAP